MESNEQLNANAILAAMRKQRKCQQKENVSVNKTEKKAGWRAQVASKACEKKQDEAEKSINEKESVLPCAALNTMG